MSKRRILVLVTAVENRHALVRPLTDVVVERRDDPLDRRRIDARAVEVLAHTLDENTRNNLINMADAGTDATTASQLASSGLANNYNTAAANNAIATVGNLFNNLSQAYLYNNLGKYANLQTGGGFGMYPSKDTSDSSVQKVYGGNFS